MKFGLVLAFLWSEIFDVWEIFLVLALVLILFGWKKLPDLAKGLSELISQWRIHSHG